MDLFIIIAAVLGVGGVVTASLYSLIDSATSSTSIVVVGASARAGPSVTGSPIAIAISIKNNGGNPIPCTPSSCQVVFVGTDTGSGNPPSCDSPCSISSGGGGVWSLGGPTGTPAANNPLTFVTDTFTLEPGAQTTFALNSALTTVGAGPTFWTAGSSVTVNVVLGTASAQVEVASQ